MADDPSPPEADPEVPVRASALRVLLRQAELHQAMLDLPDQVEFLYLKDACDVGWIALARFSRPDAVEGVIWVGEHADAGRALALIQTLIEHGFDLREEPDA